MEAESSLPLTALLADTVSLLVVRIEPASWFRTTRHFWVGSSQGPFRLQYVEVRAELGRDPRSVEIDMLCTCVSWKGGKAGDRKGGEKGAKGWGWVGAGRVSRKCCSAPLTAPLVLGNPHHKDLSRAVVEQIWPRPPPCSFPQWPCATNPDCQQQRGCSDPSGGCERKWQQSRTRTTLRGPHHFYLLE